MSSKSFPEDLTNYAAHRLGKSSILLLWLALAISTLYVSREISFASAVTGFLLTALLITQFRIWDDLVDRGYDAAKHPQRVLVVTDHVRSFTYLCGALTLPALILLAGQSGYVNLIVYLALLFAFSALYALGGNLLPRSLRAQFILLKYPVFIWLCSQNPVTERWLPVGIEAFLFLSLFEFFSDSDLRRGIAWIWIVTIEAAALLAMLILV